MKCNDISNHLVDFLYEELPAMERKEFQAHVEGCPACGAEVKAMATTLGHARQALHGPLDEAPPSRVHAQVMEAARAAAEGKVATAKARTVARPEAEGFFSRLWKTPWFMPAMGAAGVATVVLLVRVMKNPTVLPPAPSVVPEMVQQPAAEAPSAQTEAESKPTHASAPLGRDGETGKMGKRSVHENRRAGGMPSKPAKAKAPADGIAGGRKNLESDPLLGTVEGKGNAAGAGEGSSHRRAEAATARPAAKRMVDESLDDLLDSPARFAQPPRPVELARKPEAETLAPVRPAPAPAAPPTATAAPAVAAEPQLVKKQKSAPERAYQAEESAPMEAVLAKRSATAGAPSAVRLTKDVDKADKKGNGPNKEAEALKERIRKAEKLFAEKKWAEAAAAFRTLIDQAPSHPSIKTWRNRLATAEAGQTEMRAAKAKKVTNDALEGQ